MNAAPEVQREALPFLRAMFLGIVGMLMFFMLSGAFRAAGDPRTPLRLGIAHDGAHHRLQRPPDPAGSARSARRSAPSRAARSSRPTASGGCSRPDSVIHFRRGMDLAPDLGIIRSLFRFGLPTGVQGIAMNVAGVLLLRFIGSLEHSAAAQAAYAVGYTELFSLITWTSVGLMGASATIAGQNLGAGNPERATARRGGGRRGSASAWPRSSARMFLADPRPAAGAVRHDRPARHRRSAQQLLLYLSVSGLFVTVALSYTGGLQGTGDTRSPLYISIVSQIVVPLGWCASLQATRGLQPADIWLAIVLGHVTRAALSVLRFRQGRWRQIRVDIEPAQP